MTRTVKNNSCNLLLGSSAISLLAASALLAGAARAQEAGAPPQTEQPHPASPAAAPSPRSQNDAGAATEVQTVIVTGAVTSILGSKMDPTKVPNSTVSLTGENITRSGQATLTDALETQVGSVNLNAFQGNPYQPDLNYRGFTASPVEGTPIGLAVYQNGVRINEGFGDTVNWDLIPTFAIRQINLTSENPVFGLNALGGALAIETKNGFNSHGLQGEVSGGSFGRHSEMLEYGAQSGDWSIFLGGLGSDEAGWRVDQPSHVRQAYADIGYRTPDTEIHLNFSGADNSLAGTGPTPLNLLAQNYGAGIDYPGTITNSSALVELSLSQRLSTSLSVQGNLYYRQFYQNLFNGAPTSSVPCVAPLDPQTFCSANTVTGQQVQVVDRNGAPVPLSVGGAYPGETDYARTLTDAFGGTLQATSTAEVLGHGNQFIVGATVIQNSTHFNSGVLLGSLNDSRAVVDAIPVDSAGGLDSDVKLRTANNYVNLYTTDTLDLTSKLSVTASAGYNIAIVKLMDQLGQSLNGTHYFHRLNPSLGFTYQLQRGLTAFANYSEDNRVPTPAELSCAKATDPCNLASFFVADPGLKQVVSATKEIGLRGNDDLGGGRLQWTVSLYQADNYHDIISVASNVALHGYFQNAGNSRRQGVDLSTTYNIDRWRIGFDYSLLYATSRSYLTLSSPFNPDADASGDIHVHPGDLLPGQPRNRAKLNVDYDVTDKWRIGGTLDGEGSQILHGDQGNQTKPVPGFAVLNLRTSYSFNEHLQAFGTVNNVTDERFYTFGTFTTETGLPVPAGVQALAATRTYGAGAPIGGTVGIRFRF